MPLSLLLISSFSWNFLGEKEWREVKLFKCDLLPLSIQQEVPSSTAISAFGKFASFPRRFIWHSENTGGFLHHSYQEIVNVILQLTNVAVLLLQLLLVFHQLLQNLLISEVSVSCSGIKRISFLQVSIEKHQILLSSSVFPQNWLVIAFYVSHVHLLTCKAVSFSNTSVCCSAFPSHTPPEQRTGDGLPMDENFPFCHLRKKSQWGGHAASVSELVTIWAVTTTTAGRSILGNQSP